jgi:hypothetical protein
MLLSKERQDADMSLIRLLLRMDKIRVMSGSLVSRRWCDFIELLHELITAM